MPSMANKDHVRDVTRREGELQHCSCGHITRTIEEMHEHVAHPDRNASSDLAHYLDVTGSRSRVQQTP